MSKRAATAAATVAIVAATSVVAMTSGRRMALLMGDRALLQQGQWWRAFTPVLVQPSGLFALVFLVLGAIVLLPLVLAHLDTGIVLAAVLVSGLGCVALNQWREPTQSHGGSSDVIAALVGWWTVSLTWWPDTRGRSWIRRRIVGPASYGVAGPGHGVRSLLCCVPGTAPH